MVSISWCWIIISLHISKFHRFCQHPIKEGVQNIKRHWVECHWGSKTPSIRLPAATIASLDHHWLRPQSDVSVSRRQGYGKPNLSPVTCDLWVLRQARTQSITSLLTYREVRLEERAAGKTSQKTISRHPGTIFPRNLLAVSDCTLKLSRARKRRRM